MSSKRHQIRADSERKDRKREREVRGGEKIEIRGPGPCDLGPFNLPPSEVDGVT